MNKYPNFITAKTPAQQESFRKWLVITSISFTMAMIFCLGITLYYVYALYQLSPVLNVLQKKVATTSAPLTNSLPHEALQTLLRKTQSYDLYSFLQTLVHALEKDIKYSAITINTHKTIVLTGQSHCAQSLEKLTTALTQSPYLNTITLTSVSQSHDNLVHFSLTGKISK